VLIRTAEATGMAVGAADMAVDRDPEAVDMQEHLHY